MRSLLYAFLLCSCTATPAPSGSEGGAPMPWPHNQELPISDNIQGVSHDAEHWYFASRSGHPGGRISRAKRDADLTDPASYAWLDRPFPGWTHPGDLDHHDGWLYVALSVQFGDRPHNAIGAIPTRTMLDRDTYRALELKDGPQSRGERLPWVARDPETGYFYSSRFYTSRLERYAPTYDAQGGPIGFRWCGSVEVTEPLWRVQGGVFTPEGRLILATDPRHREGIRQGALLVLDMRGHLDEHPRIDCDAPPKLGALGIEDRWFLPKAPGSIYLGGDEVEGITWWDLGGKQTHEGRATGQVHVLIVDQDLMGDDVTFEHIRAPDLKRSGTR